MKKELKRLKKIRALAIPLHQKAAKEGINEEIIRFDLHNIEKKSPPESLKKSLKMLKKCGKAKRENSPGTREKTITHE